MRRLTRSELRIIEQTKREGAELHGQERRSGSARKRPAWLSLVMLGIIFFVLAFGMKLLISLFR